jgi:hypothetical protein
MRTSKPIATSTKGYSAGSDAVFCGALPILFLYLTVNRENRKHNKNEKYVLDNWAHYLGSLSFVNYFLLFAVIVEYDLIKNKQ